MSSRGHSTKKESEDNAMNRVIKITLIVLGVCLIIMGIFLFLSIGIIPFSGLFK